MSHLAFLLVVEVKLVHLLQTRAVIHLTDSGSEHSNFLHSEREIEGIRMSPI